MPRKRSAGRRRTSVVEPKDLQRYAAAQWKRWLQNGISVWLAPRDLGDKVSAFAPLVLDENERADLAIHRQLVKWLSGAATASLRQGISSFISSWSSDDTIDELRFGLRLATRFGCSDLDVSIGKVLAKPLPLSRATRIEFALAVGDALQARCTTATTLAVGTRLRIKSLLPWQAAIPLFVHVVASDPTQYDIAARSLCPEWAPDWFKMETGDETELLALELVDAFEPEGLLHFINGKAQPDPIDLVALDFRKFALLVAQQHAMKTVQIRIDSDSPTPSPNVLASISGELATGETFAFQISAGPRSPLLSLRDYQDQFQQFYDNSFLNGGVETKLQAHEARGRPAT